VRCARGEWGGGHRDPRDPHAPTDHPWAERRAVSQQRSTIARTRRVAGGGEEDDRVRRERAIVVHSASERASASEMRTGGVRSKK